MVDGGYLGKRNKLMSGPFPVEVDRPQSLRIINHFQQQYLYQNVIAATSVPIAEF